MVSKLVLQTLRKIAKSGYIIGPKEKIVENVSTQILPPSQGLPTKSITEVGTTLNLMF